VEGTSKSANQLTVGLQALIANSTVQRCAEDTQWSRFIASNGSNIGNSVCRIVMNERLMIERHLTDLALEPIPFLDTGQMLPLEVLVKSPRPANL